MSRFSRGQICEIGCRVLQGAGLSATDAAVVANELADANAVGHDSHGIIRLRQYVSALESGNARSGAEIQVVVDLPSIAVLDAGFSFGQVAMSKAYELAAQRARRSGAFTILCRNSYHVGRLGSYTRRAAQEGFAALMAVNGPAASGVVPWGGLDPRMGTNPISMAAPWNEEPIVLDMTTSATAEGKVRVAAQKGEAIPEGWVIDKHGNPTTNPNDFYDGGAILPLGGPLGFKGYGLGVMLDVFCGVLTGSGVGRKDMQPGNNGIWFHLLDVQQVMDQKEYSEWIGRYADWLKGSKLAPGVDEILLPGEIEARRFAEREKTGIPLPDETWRQTVELADRLNVSLNDL